MDIMESLKPTDTTVMRFIIADMVESVAHYVNNMPVLPEIRKNIRSCIDSAVQMCRWDQTPIETIKNLRISIYDIQQEMVRLHISVILSPMDSDALEAGIITMASAFCALSFIIYGGACYIYDFTVLAAKKRGASLCCGSDIEQAKQVHESSQIARNERIIEKHIG